MRLYPFAQNHQEAVTFATFGHAPFLWVFVIGLSIVSTSCLKCKLAAFTLKHSNDEIRAYPNREAQLSFNRDFLQRRRKDLPPVAKSIMITAFHRTKREVGFSGGNIKMKMFDKSKFKMPRSVLYSIPAVVIIVLFLCCLTFYCDVPHQ